MSARRITCGMARLLATIVLVCVLGLPSNAHESRPALLDMTEQETGLLKVLWKVPIVRGRLLSIDPVFPDTMKPIGSPVREQVPGAWIERSTYKMEGGTLTGQSIVIDKLPATQTDVLVRISLADGRALSMIVRPQSPSFVIPEQAGKWQVASSYWLLGVEHILGGYDHLLFVLALILIIPTYWLLFKAITAFTVAHSITLGLAALGFVHVPPAPTEAVIALSIVLLAVEIAHFREGRIGITARYPWVVSGLFGLVHGLGFAGALSEIGLPEHEIPLALLAFNIGVESGQILFVLIVIAIMAVIGRLIVIQPPWAWRIAAYGIGGISAYWMIDRIAGFV